MNYMIFLFLLSGFSTATAVITECIKKVLSDKKNLGYNLIAMITAIIVGGVGTSIYYYLNDIAFTGKNIVCIILLAFASGLCSMVGFDKVKELIEQLNNKGVD